MSDKKIKLIYFNFRGRGELARLILVQAGVQFEDFRLEKSEWPNHKPSKFNKNIIQYFII